MMNNLPPELSALAALLDAQPGPVQQAFQYCLAQLMVEAGKARLVATTPGEAGTLCTFETVSGDVFTLPRPPMTEEQEAVLMEGYVTFLMKRAAYDGPND